MALQAGDSIGGFRLVSQLGEGGMGVVWLAEEEAGEKRRAALKVLPDELAQNEELHERFLREGKYATAVKHPNIAEVYGAGEQDGQLWLAMRFLEGTDLSTIIRRGGPLQPRRAIAILGQVAAALDEAAKAGLLHRDIKPANIVMASNNGSEQAYVIDFGLGKAPQTDEQGLTKPGQFVGTIDYTAPEQITQNQTLDGKVDQYSLACVFYEMLTGEVPFPKKRDVEVIMAHVGEPPPKATEKREGLPAEVDDVIAKGMSKDPTERYESSTAMFEAASAAMQPVIDKELATEGMTPAGADTVWLMFESGDDKGKIIPVTGDEFVIGRDEGADLQILDTRVSRRHASLKVMPGGNAELRDMDSANGTMVNGAPVKSAVLTGTERLRVGDTEFTFYPVDPVRAKTTVGITDKGPRLSAVMRQRGQSAIQRLRIEKKLRNLTFAAGGTILAVLLVVVLLVTGVLGGGGGVDTAKIVSAVGPSTALIRSDAGETGSGWALDAGQGLVVTNGHVVNRGSTFQVGVKGKLRPAAVVASAPCEDLAILKVTPATGLKTLPLASQTQVKEGDDAIAVGFPQSASSDAQLTATKGVVSVAKTQYRELAPDIPQYPNVIQTDTALNPGNSGGPLVNKDARLIGVNSAVRTVNQQGRAIQNQNFAIGVDRVKQVVDFLRTGKSLQWTGLNLVYRETDFFSASKLTTGIVASTSVKGSPADKAGINGGKTLLIIGVNGKRMENTLASYCAATAGIQSGQEATFTVQDISDPANPSKPRALKLKFA